MASTVCACFRPGLACSAAAPGDVSYKYSVTQCRDYKGIRNMSWSQKSVTRNRPGRPRLWSKCYVCFWTPSDDRQNRMCSADDPKKIGPTSNSRRLIIILFDTNAKSAVQQKLSWASQKPRKKTYALKKLWRALPTLDVKASESVSLKALQQSIRLWHSKWCVTVWPKACSKQKHRANHEECVICSTTQADVHQASSGTAWYKVSLWLFC